MSLSPSHGTQTVGDPSKDKTEGTSAAKLGGNPVAGGNTTLSWLKGRWNMGGEERRFLQNPVTVCGRKRRKSSGKRFRGVYKGDFGAHNKVDTMKSEKIPAACCVGG